MFFIIWGWAQRVNTSGFAGPFTCGECGWIGTFWVRSVERRFKLYFIQLGKWRPRGTFTVCRNCGKAFAVPVSEVPALMASVRPINAPDPFGPQPADVVPLADQPPNCQHCGAPVAGDAQRCGSCGEQLHSLRGR